MARVLKLEVQNYRSVKERVRIKFPGNSPLVLVGENNAGKSNLARALELILGERWPSTYEPEDHDYHDRDDGNSPIGIGVAVDDLTHYDASGYPLPVTHLRWRYPVDDGNPFGMILQTGEVRYVTKATREQLFCIVVGADRRLAYQLSYSSKYTLLSKVMRRFHEELTHDPERVASLRTEFSQIKDLFQGVGPFAAFSDELRRQVDELSSNLQYRLEIDFSAYDPSNYVSVHGPLRSVD